MSAVRWQGAALVLDLHVQPGARRDEIVGIHGDRLKLKIAAPPVDGRANRHLLEFIADLFGVSKARVTLLRGETGRAKTVHIEAPTRFPDRLAIPPRS